MRRPGLTTLVLPVLLIGTIGTVVGAFSRQSDTEFIARQQNLATLAPAALERFVASAPDPRPGTGMRRGIGARCSARGVGALRNPWVCTVRYPVGPGIRYRVTVDPTGQVRGASPDGAFVVNGCCVGFRPTP